MHRHLQVTMDDHVLKDILLRSVLGEEETSKVVAQGCSLEKLLLKNFAKFTGNHLSQSLFLIKLLTILKKRL